MARLNVTPARALDSNANPISGGTRTVYKAGTTTPVTTYADAPLTTAHPQAIPADASGFFPEIYVPDDAEYKVIDRDSLGATVWTGDFILPGVALGLTGQFATRAEAVAGRGPYEREGRVISAGGISYRYTGTGTAIADLPGWVPQFQPRPEHFADNATPGTTDMSSAIAAADTYAKTTSVVSEVVLSDTQYRTNSSIAKATTTFWRGPGPNRSGGGEGAEIVSYHDGTAVLVTGDGVNRRGGIESIRIRNGDPVTYPNADGLRFVSDARDQIVSDCYIASYRRNIEVDGGKAIYFDRAYSFGATDRGCWVHNGSTDCWFTQSQFDGDNYGLDLDGSDGPLGSMLVHLSRPQVSGASNIRAWRVSYLQIIGGLSDTAINGGHGKGLEIIDCNNFTVSGMIFYANGDGKAHIYIDSTAGFTCGDGTITGCVTQESASNTGTTVGIQFGPCAGSTRRISIDGNALYPVDQSIKFNTVTGSLTDIKIGAGNIIRPGTIIGETNVSSGLDIAVEDRGSSFAASTTPATLFSASLPGVVYHVYAARTAGGSGAEAIVIGGTTPLIVRQSAAASGAPELQFSVTGTDVQLATLTSATTCQYRVRRRNL